MFLTNGINDEIYFKVNLAKHYLNNQAVKASAQRISFSIVGKEKPAR